MLKRRAGASPIRASTFAASDPTETLILVNGRRLPTLANQNFSPRQADINGIPVGAIERIEVLPSSAGGIYGGNAIGGVINIILRSDYRGIEIGLTYNDSRSICTLPTDASTLTAASRSKAGVQR